MSTSKAPIFAYLLTSWVDKGKRPFSCILREETFQPIGALNYMILLHTLLCTSGGPFVSVLWNDGIGKLDRTPGYPISEEREDGVPKQKWQLLQKRINAQQLGCAALRNIIGHGRSLSKAAVGFGPSVSVSHMTLNSTFLAANERASYEFSETPGIPFHSSPLYIGPRVSPRNPVTDEDFVTGARG